nr:putative protein 2 [Linvill Road virus]
MVGQDEDLDPVANSSNADGTAGSRNVRSTGGNASASGGGNSGMRGIAPLYQGIRYNIQSGVRTYTKQYRLRIHNLAIDAKSVTNGTESFSVIRYPYHDLPVHMLGFYLTKDEISMLMGQTSARVKQVGVEIHHKTAVLTFETNSSTTNIGNNNIGAYLCHISEDIGPKRFGLTADNIGLIENTFWGNHATNITSEDWTEELGDLGCEFITKNYDHRFHYYSPKVGSEYTSSIPSLEYNYNFFNIHPFVDYRVNASMNEGLFCQYQYVPEHGLVAGKYLAGKKNFAEAVTYYRKNPKSVISGLEGEESIRLPVPEASGVNQENIDENYQYLRLPYRNYKETEYSSLQIDDRAYPMHSGKQQPPLVIGLESLWSSIGNKNTVVPCHVDIIVNTYCEIECDIGTDYVHPSGGKPFIPHFINPPLVNNIFDKDADENVVLGQVQSKNYLSSKTMNNVPLYYNTNTTL